uniref:Uncharacterized protein n=1 Tax=Pseudo-nitzschia arenysensis TaxID=697910 RepID=A0A7R9ZUE3_9STRA|mmetsp:Transcript_876/g.2021  ORF Transcript_876/g.2021 Transcript_876/m.2021 type:complete len:507 (+) Transcript_876:122-1642(+)
MDFPKRIEGIEGEVVDSWNDEIEEFLAKPQSPMHSSDSVDIDNEALQSSLGNIVSGLEQRLRGSFGIDGSDECDPDIGRAVRTSKNLLRWYIQIYLEQVNLQRQRQKSQDVCRIDVLRSTNTLSSVIEILKWSVEGDRNLKLAHNASLYIFYATYSHFPGDKIASTGIGHLISNHDFPNECLHILMKTNEIPLALTLVRNLHSMTVSFPTARASILNAKVRFDSLSNEQSPPWAPTEETTINFTDTCLALIRYSIDSSPLFPSDDPEDKRADLVIEILNCFYAMRKGQELVHPTTAITTGNHSLSFDHLIVRILQLSHLTQSTNENTDVAICKRTLRCKLSAVSILMDSDVSFGKYLVENDSFGGLLDIFQHQVNDVVDNTKVDGSATASLVPILVVLNRYAAANSIVQETVKKFVFPAETEKNIQQSTAKNRKNKMSPLDAPKDTLRGKLIALLSWVDGYIKRCSAELMWTICDSNSSEFTFRVGLGNALPLLNSKGLSPIPIPS